MSTDVIDRGKVWIVPIRLKRPHKMSFGEVTHAQLVVTKLVSRSGVVGYGEVTILDGPFWNEESSESVFSVLKSYLIPWVIGADVLYIRDSEARIAPIRGNRFAKACLNIALNDLRARSLDLTLSESLGGASSALPVPMSWSLASNDQIEESEEIKVRYDEGFRIFKAKAGGLTVGEDIKRIAALRSEIPDDASFRIDANQGWFRAEATAAIKALGHLDIAYLEQPLEKDDIEGLARLQSTSPIPLAADESICSMHDAVALIQHDAARVFVYKVAKHGGIQETERIASVAESLGVAGYLGNMIESSLGTAAYLATASLGLKLDFGCELFGPLLLEEDIVEEQLLPVKGAITRPAGVGLGVNVDEKKVDYLCTVVEDIKYRY